MSAARVGAGRCSAASAWVFELFLVRYFCWDEGKNGGGRQGLGRSIDACERGVLGTGIATLREHGYCIQRCLGGQETSDGCWPWLTRMPMSLGMLGVRYMLSAIKPHYYYYPVTCVRRAVSLDAFEPSFLWHRSRAS